MGETIKGLQIKIGADTTEFKKGLKSVDKDINTTEKQVNALQESLKIKFDPTRFEEAQRLAQDAISKTEQKAQKLREELKYLEEHGTDKTSKSYRELETQLIQTEAKAVKLNEKLKELNTIRLDNISKRFTEFGSDITKLGNSLMPLSLASTGMLASFYKLGTSAVKAGDDIATLANQIGLSAEELQKWQYIAMQTDVTDSQLQTGLTKVQVALADLATGVGSSATQTLEKLGITAEKASRGMNANFEELIYNLSNITDPILQASYANEIFGDKLGAKIIPLLSAGGQGLAQLADEFENLDYLTNEQVADFAEFDNVMNKIKQQFINIKNQLGSALLPVMKQIAQIIQETIIPKIQQLSNLLQSLSSEQVELILKILAVVSAVAPLLMIVGKLITSIGTITKSIGGLSKVLTTLSAHPIILVIGVLAGLIALLYTRNEKFRESVNDILSSLQTSLQPVLESITSLIQELMEVLGPLVDDILEAVAPILTDLLQGLAKLISYLASRITPALERTKILIQPIAQVIGSIAKVMGNILIPIIRTLMERMKPLIELIEKYAVPAFTKFGEIITQVFSGIPDVINSVLGWLEVKVNNVIDFINNIIKGINKLGEALGFSISELDHVKLQLETGSLDINDNTTSKPVNSTAESLITDNTNNLYSGTSVVNNDYSNKDIVINVNINNYGEEIDTEALIRDINLKLAEQM